MYPIIRLITSSVSAISTKPIHIGSVFKTTFRCMPWDLDLFLEMNNGRVLTLYDLGRFDLAIRSGLLKLLIKKKWGLVVAGASVRYRRRIKFLDKVTIHTQIVGFERQWIYIVQSMWVKNQPVSSILLRTGVTGKGKAIPADEILRAMNVLNWKPELPEWVTSWINIEKVRPWPPESI